MYSDHIVFIDNILHSHISFIIFTVVKHKKLVLIKLIVETGNWKLETGNLKLNLVPMLRVTAIKLKDLRDFNAAERQGDKAWGF